MKVNFTGSTSHVPVGTIATGHGFIHGGMYLIKIQIVAWDSVTTNHDGTIAVDLEDGRLVYFDDDHKVIPYDATIDV